MVPQTEEDTATFAPPLHVTRWTCGKPTSMPPVSALSPSRSIARQYTIKLTNNSLQPTQHILVTEPAAMWMDAKSTRTKQIGLSMVSSMFLHSFSPIFPSFYRFCLTYINRSWTSS